jgi:hypothetical protein
MKLSFRPGERAALVAQLGLAESASNEEIGAAVAARLMDTPAPGAASGPSPQASAGPEEYPAEWLPPSQLAPWPRPAPRVTSVQRVTHGSD